MLVQFHLEFQLVNHLLKNTIFAAPPINDKIVNFTICSAMVMEDVLKPHVFIFTLHRIETSTDHKCFTMITIRDFVFGFIINRLHLFLLIFNFFYKRHKSSIWIVGSQMSKIMTLETLRARCRWTRRR